MQNSSNTEDLLPSREVTIETTTFCGASCAFCPRDQYRYAPAHMSDELFIKALDESVALGITSLDTCAFGDLFIDPKYKERLRYVHAHYPHLKVFASTTGHMLNRSSLDVLDCLHTIKFSMYGITKEVYESLHRGALKYEKVLENINRICAIPRDKRPYLIMSLLVLPENKHQVDEWKSYWEGKVDEITVWLPHNFGGTIDEFNDTKKSVKKSCNRPFFGNPVIHVDGEVSVCCFDYNHDLIIGNICHESLREIMTGKKLAHIRDVHKAGTFDSSDLHCKNCDQLLDRSDKLLYSSNKARKVGVVTSHADQMNDLLAGTH